MGFNLKKFWKGTVETNLKNLPGFIKDTGEAIGGFFGGISKPGTDALKDVLGVGTTTTTTQEGGGANAENPATKSNTMLFVIIGGGLVLLIGLVLIFSGKKK